MILMYKTPSTIILGHFASMPLVCLRCNQTERNFECDHVNLAEMAR